MQGRAPGIRAGPPRRTPKGSGARAPCDISRGSDSRGTTVAGQHSAQRRRRPRPPWLWRRNRGNLTEIMAKGTGTGRGGQQRPRRPRPLQRNAVGGPVRRRIADRNWRTSRRSAVRGARSRQHGHRHRRRCGSRSMRASSHQGQKHHLLNLRPRREQAIGAVGRSQPDSSRSSLFCGGGQLLAVCTRNWTSQLSSQSSSAASPGASLRPRRSQKRRKPGPKSGHGQCQRYL